MSLGTEEYYRIFIALQDKLRKSEEERLNLEMKFNEMVQYNKAEDQAHFRKVRSQYKRFMEEEKLRQDRNERITKTLERIDHRLAALIEKTERLKGLRQHFNAVLGKRNRVQAIMNLHQEKEAKSRFLEKYLYDIDSVSQQELHKRFAEAELLKDQCECQTRPNHANVIAEDIMDSIISRHRNRIHGIISSGSNNKFDLTSKSQEQFNLEPARAKETPVEDYTSEAESIIMKPEITSTIKDAENLHNLLENQSGDRIQLRNTPGQVNLYNAVQQEATLKGPISSGDTHQQYQDRTACLDNNEQTISQPDHIVEPYESQEQITLTTNYNNASKESIQRDNLSGKDEQVYDEQITIPHNDGNSPVHQQMNEIVQSLEEKNDQSIQQYNPQCSSPMMQIDENIPLLQQIQAQDVLTTQSITEYDQSAKSFQQYDAPSITQFNANVQPIQQYNVPSTPSMTQSDADLQPIQQYYVPTCTPSMTQFDENSEPVPGTPSRTQVDENSQPIQQYDEQGNTVQQYDALGVLEMPQYDENGLHQSYDAQKHPQYDENYGIGQPIQQYDENGQPIQQFHENGQLIQQQYEQNGQFIQQYDENGQPIEQYDENGVLIQHQYDANAQLMQQYDENGQLIQQYDENGQLIQQYDENGQPIQQYDSQANQYQYDENGHPIQQYDENGQLIQQYDENGQLLQQYHNETGEYVQQGYEADQQYEQTITGQPAISQLDENEPLVEQYDENGQPLVQQFDSEYQQNGEMNQQYNENGEINQQYNENGEINQQYNENGEINQPYNENGLASHENVDDGHQAIEQLSISETPNKDKANEVVVDDGQVEISDEISKSQEQAVEDKKNVIEMLDTDTESAKQDTKISNDSDFDFSNG